MELTSELYKSDSDTDNFLKRPMVREKTIETLRQETSGYETQMGDAKKHEPIILFSAYRQRKMQEKAEEAESSDSSYEQDMEDERIELQQECDEPQKKLTDMVDEKNITKCNMSLNESKFEIRKEKKWNFWTNAYLELVKEYRRELEMKNMSVSQRIRKQESEITSLRNEFIKAESMAAYVEGITAKKEKKIQTLLKDLSAKDEEKRRLKMQLSSSVEEKDRIHCLHYDKIKLIKKIEAALKNKKLNVAKREQNCMDLIQDSRLLQARLSKEAQTRGILQKRVARASLPVSRQEFTKVRKQLPEANSKKRLEENITKPTNMYKHAVASRSGSRKG